MAISHKGKSFSFVLFLYILAAIFVSCSCSLPDVESVFEPKPDPQEVLLHKLEELVKNLSEIVAKLETKLSDSVSPLDDREEDKIRIEQAKFDTRKSVVKAQEDLLEAEINQDGDNRGKTVSVTKFSPFWSERFQFISAVKLNSEATCINVLPFRDFEGLSKYIAVGDDRGRVHILSQSGDVLAQYSTLCDSPVTSMMSYFAVYKNESIVVTGHENGVLLVHKVFDRPNGEEFGSLSMENIGKFVPSEEERENRVAITTLEVHHVGRLRYILSSDLIGKIQVFRENGTIHGSATPRSRPIAFLKQRLLFLSESGAGSLDLKYMKVRESECEGLNHSLVMSYAFDATERSKAYGVTSEGDLIHVLLLGDIVNFKCRVRSKRKFDLVGPLGLQAIKGYLIMINEEKVFALNVSSQHYVRVGGPRLLFSTGLDEIRSAFLNYQAGDPLTDEKNTIIPLIASDREKLVVLGLGNGYVGIYRSNLPIFKGDFNTMLWTSPVLFFILFLFGAWQFFAKKKEALTSWGPDDPFSSTSGATGAPLGSSSGDRAFPDSSSRRDDMMDLRGSGLRGASCRYGSPTRYPGGGTGSFRPGASDANSRASVVDPNYRTSSELKYRGPGPGLEPPGFPNRRDSMFGNNQVMDDSS